MPRQKRSNEIRLDDALNNIYIDSPRKRGRMEKHSPKSRTRSMPSSQIKKGYVSTTGPANDSNLLEPPAFLALVPSNDVYTIPSMWQTDLCNLWSIVNMYHI